MSSRLMPPKATAIFLIVSTISCGSFVFRQIGKASTPPNSLKSWHLPSITGIAAAGPMSPKPKTAVPSETTATVFFLMVSVKAFSGSLESLRRRARRPACKPSTNPSGFSEAFSRRFRFCRRDASEKCGRKSARLPRRRYFERGDDFLVVLFRRSVDRDVADQKIFADRNDINRFDVAAARRWRS
jgi:hypothetical protein